MGFDAGASIRRDIERGADEWRSFRTINEQLPKLAKEQEETNQLLRRIIQLLEQNEGAQPGK